MEVLLLLMLALAVVVYLALKDPPNTQQTPLHPPSPSPEQPSGPTVKSQAAGPTIPADHAAYLKKDLVMVKALEQRFDFDEICNIEIYGHWLAALDRGDLKPLSAELESLLDLPKDGPKSLTAIKAAWDKYKTLRVVPIVCGQCAGKGHYSDPITGGRLTCSRCHGAGKIGFTKSKITVTGSY
ncbi:hypothetical protein D3C85_937630 [compost metagenome]